MEEKKALNLKRTLAQKRKKQREKEMAQLEALLRASGDIYDGRFYFLCFKPSNKRSENKKLLKTKGLAKNQIKLPILN